MRGGSAAYTAFFTESFIDELAVEAERDPFLYRMALLGEAPRMAECLRRATRLANWDGGRQGSGQGLALVRMGRDPKTAGHIACVAEAGPGVGGVSVSRLSVACDIGRVVNLDIARQQIEGGLIFGLSQAMGASVRYESGRPVPRTMGGLNLPGSPIRPRSCSIFSPVRRRRSIPANSGLPLPRPPLPTQCSRRPEDAIAPFR